MADLIPNGPQHVTGHLTPQSQTLTGNLDGHGTKDYDYLVNKPSIEGVTLEGNKTFEDLNLRPCTNAELAALLD